MAMSSQIVFHQKISEIIPVSHYHHVVCCSSERVDDSGVAGDHDDAGDDEGDN